jgi:predicted oxidoreductase
MSVPRIELAAGGPQVSRLVAGVMRLVEWDLTPAERVAWIQACLAMGITTFDHADIYGDYRCEQLFGEALTLDPSLRGRMQLVTKCGIKLVSERRPAHQLKHYDTSPGHIVASVERSLQNLHTDHVDLLLIHRPDPLMNPAELVEAFQKLHQDGKVLYFGVSNFSPSQFDLLSSCLDRPLVTNQVEISLLQPQALYDGTLDQCRQQRIAPMAWSPLGGGRLFRGRDGRTRQLRLFLQAVGEELGEASVAQVALAWLLRHPADIVPVLGSGRVERLREAAAATNLHLGREQWFSILRAATGRDVP